MLFPCSHHPWSGDGRTRLYFERTNIWTMVWKISRHSVWQCLEKGLISGNFDLDMVWSEVVSTHNCLDDGLPLVGSLAARKSWQWSVFGLIGGHFRLEKSDQRHCRAHFERTRCFESTLVLSNDTLVITILVTQKKRNSKKFGREHSDVFNEFCDFWDGSLMFYFDLTYDWLQSNLLVHHGYICLVFLFLSIEL